MSGVRNMSGAVDPPAGSTRLDAYVEHGTGMAYDRGVVAWTFDPNAWGRCGQGEEEPSALAGLAAAVDVDPDELIVVERIYGDELAFSRDHVPATDTELDACTAHVRAAVLDMPDHLVRRHRDEEWTSTKVLRRLAWHERGELRAMRDLAVANAALLGLRLQLPASAD